MLRMPLRPVTDPVNIPLLPQRHRTGSVVKETLVEETGFFDEESDVMLTEDDFTDEDSALPLTTSSSLIDESEPPPIDFFTPEKTFEPSREDNLVLNNREVELARYWVIQVENCCARIATVTSLNTASNETASTLPTDNDHIGLLKVRLDKLKELLAQAKVQVNDFGNDRIGYQQFVEDFSILKIKAARQAEQACAIFSADDFCLETVVWIKDSLAQIKNMCPGYKTFALEPDEPGIHARTLQSLQELKPLIAAIGNSHLDSECDALIHELDQVRISEHSKGQEWEAGICERLNNLKLTILSIDQSPFALIGQRLSDLTSNHVLSDQPLMTCGRAKVFLKLLTGSTQCQQSKDISHICTHLITTLDQAQGSAGDDTPLNFDQWQRILCDVQRILLILGAYKPDTAALKRQLCLDISNFEYFYSWCQSQVPKAQGEPSVTMESPQDFLRVVTVICHSLRGLNDQVNKKLLELMELLVLPGALPSTQEKFSAAKQWATISLACKALAEVAVEKIAAKQKETIHPLTNRGFSLPFIRTSLQNLALIANLQWAEAGAAVVEKNLSKYYFDYFDPAHSESTSTSATLSSKLVEGMPGGFAEVTGTRKVGTTIDRENYIGAIKTTSAGFRSGYECGLPLLRLFLLSIGAAFGEGQYVEYSKVSDFVKSNFADLVTEHRYNHDLVPFICRHSTLGQAKNAGDEITLQHLSQLRAIYKLKRNEISRCFEILLGAPPGLHIHAKEPQEETTIIKLPAVSNNHILPLELDLRTRSGKGELSAGPQTSMIKMAAGISGEASETTLPLFRRKFLIEKMAELEERNASDAEIIAEIKRSAEQLLKKIPKDAPQYIKPSVADSLYSLLFRLVDFFLNLFPTSENQLTQDQSWPIPEVYREGQHAGYHAVGRKYRHDKAQEPATSHSVLTVSDPEFFVLEKPTVKHQLNLLESNLTTLRRDVGYHASLKASTVPTTELSLQQFYKLYLTEDTEDWLYRMQLINAYVYILVTEQEKQPRLTPEDQARITTLKRKLRDFERELNDPPFAINNKKLRELVTHRELFELRSREDKVSINAELNIAVPGLGTLSPLRISGSRSYKSRDHTQPLTDGEFVELELKITGSILEVGPAVNAIMAVLIKDARLKDLPGLREQLEAQISPGGSLTATRSFLWQWEKTTFIPDIDYTYLTRREIRSATQDRSVATTFPLSLFRVNHTQQRTWLGSEVYSPETIQLFLLLYLHDFSLGNILENGEIRSDTEVFWRKVEDQQQESLKKLFINIANRDAGDQQSIALKKELAGLHQVYLADVRKNSAFLTDISADAECQRLDSLRSALFIAAENYRNGPSEEVYKRTLGAFKDLMRGYAPHHQHIRATTRAFKPIKLALPLTLPRTLPPIWSRIREAVPDVVGNPITQAPLSVRKGQQKDFSRLP